jgi:hypothetical protein
MSTNQNTWLLDVLQLEWGEPLEWEFEPLEWHNQPIEFEPFEIEFNSR